MSDNRDGDDPDSAALVDFDAMLPGMGSRLRAHAEERFRLEHPWSGLVVVGLGAGITGVVVASLFWGGQVVCGAFVVGMAVTLAYTLWRKRQIDRYIRQHLAGQARCRGCGYRLEGLQSVNCPECGKRVRL